MTNDLIMTLNCPEIWVTLWQSTPVWWPALWLVNTPLSCSLIGWPHVSDDYLWFVSFISSGAWAITWVSSLAFIGNWCGWVITQLGGRTPVSVNMTRVERLWWLSDSFLLLRVCLRIAITNAVTMLAAADRFLALTEHSHSCIHKILWEQEYRIRFTYSHRPCMPAHVRGINTFPRV